MPDHRVPLLGDALRRREDPEKSRDPRVRSLVAQLSTLSAGPAPDPDFRADLRAQLVAITPRLVAEAVAEDAAMIEIVPRPTPVPATKVVEQTGARWSFGRVVGITACLLTAFAMLLGGAVLMSRHALPGDSLYGLKRAAERFELATDGSDGERASDMLGFARLRTSEATELVTRAGGNTVGATIDAQTVSLVDSTLTSANSDIVDATRLLAQQAVSDNSAAPLATMTNWVPGQLKRMKSLIALPAVSAVPALRQTAILTTTLASKAQARARALITSVDCSCMLTAPSDEFGPVPCTKCPTPVTGTGTGTSPTRTRTTSPPTAAAPVRSASPVKPVTGSPVTVSPQNPLGSASTQAKPGKLFPTPGNVPTGPVITTTPPLPVTISSGCVKVPVLHTSIGQCPSSSPSR